MKRFSAVKSSDRLKKFLREANGESPSTDSTFSSEKSMGNLIQLDSY